MVSIQENIYGYDEDGIFINKFIGGKANFQIIKSNIELTQTSNYPWEGLISFKINIGDSKKIDVGIRVPDWCKQYSLTLNEVSLKEFSKKDGYVIINRLWENNDLIEFSMEMNIQKIVVHPYVNALKDKVAIQHGPLIYCIESFDNCESGMNFSLAKETEFDIKQAII